MEKNYKYNIKGSNSFEYPIDIIIPFHGQYDQVTGLIDSIYRYTAKVSYTVCLVDDFSANEEFIKNVSANMISIIRKHNIPHEFRFIRNAEQKGFAASLRVGYNSGDSPYVCFLNSDCRIEDRNWLFNLLDALSRLKSQKVRMVSPLTNEIVGGDEAQRGERFNQTDDYVILENNAHLSMYCVLCHRELFLHCGGFLKEYPYGMYEDEEFAFRMRACGFKQAVCRSSWIYHEGMATISNLWKKDPKIYDEMEVKNRERCIEDMKIIKKKLGNTAK